MKATVLRDPRLVKLAGRFAWLSVDAERERNEAFLEKFPIDGYPTFLFIDPKAEQPLLRWAGSADVRQFARLLDDALVARKAAAGDGPEARLARADRLGADGKPEEAAAAYRAALEAGGPRWERRPRAVESLVGALSTADRHEACARAALELAPALPRGSSFANAAATGLSCALAADKAAPWRAGALVPLETLARTAAQLRGLLADDRAGVLDTLAAAREDAGDEAGAREVRVALQKFLDREAAGVRSPEERAALDSWRVGTAIALGEPARALPALQASERDLPDDYSPPYRQALVYRELGRWDEMAAAAGRAVDRAYGPRKLRCYDLLAAAQGKQGDRAAQARTLAAAVAHAGALPPGQAGAGVKRLAAKFQGQLDELRAAAPAEARPAEAAPSTAR